MISVVVGPPCAGKSTHVAQSANDGDVRIDYDKIAQVIGAQQSHAASGAIRDVAFSMRQAAINRILKGIDGGSWIIHTRPSPELIDEYVQAGAAFIVLSPGLDVCLQRAIDDGRPDGTEAAIRDWYDNPPEIPGYEHVASNYNMRTPLLARLTELQQR